jgi:hypothetical protein
MSSEVIRVTGLIPEYSERPILEPVTITSSTSASSSESCAKVGVEKSPSVSTETNEYLNKLNIETP